jgi:hypothetical protein
MKRFENEDVYDESKSTSNRNRKGRRERPDEKEDISEDLHEDEKTMKAEPKPKRSELNKPSRTSEDGNNWMISTNKIPTDRRGTDSIPIV